MSIDGHCRCPPHRKHRRCRQPHGLCKVHSLTTFYWLLQRFPLLRCNHHQNPVSLVFSFKPIALYIIGELMGLTTSIDLQMDGKYTGLLWESLQIGKGCKVMMRSWEIRFWLSWCFQGHAHEHILILIHLSHTYALSSIRKSLGNGEHMEVRQ